jgi:phosphatidylinositol alpha-1,6-mannosyltransferase
VKLLYLTPGCFDKGGISRYSRYQISSLREILGNGNLQVCSLLGPDEESFEEPFEVDWYAGGKGFFNKAAFVLWVSAASFIHRPGIIWSAHVSYSAVIQIIAWLIGAKTVVNEYGVEAWSGLSWDAEWGLKRVSYVVSDCHFTARYLESKGFRPEGSIVVLWDCVDLDKFSPGNPSQKVITKYGLPDPARGVNLLTLGRMGRESNYKGYSRLLEVFMKVTDEIPELRLIYVGRGELVEDLREKVRQLGLENRVFFTGMASEEDLADIYRSAHIFSLVSERGVGRGEGIPLTPLEAAACGIPIIVGNQDGSQEAVVEGTNGFIIDPFDLESHTQAIVMLAKDSTLRERMGCAARRRIEDNFSYTIFREKHRPLLQRWLSGNKNSF